MINEPEVYTRPDAELASEYDQYLDDCYGDIEVAGQRFSTSYALKELDPTAYDIGYGDWVDELPTQWSCPICGCLHDDDADAKWCCQAQPECTKCGCTHDTEEAADACCADEEVNA